MNPIESSSIRVASTFEAEAAFFYQDRVMRPCVVGWSQSPVQIHRQSNGVNSKSSKFDRDDLLFEKVAGSKEGAGINAPVTSFELGILRVSPTRTSGYSGDRRFKTSHNGLGLTEKSFPYRARRRGEHFHSSFRRRRGRQPTSKTRSYGMD
jgi:hypothetical protein